MVQILRPLPKQSFSSQLGLSVGSGIGQGVMHGYERKLAQEAQKAKEAHELERLEREYALRSGLLEKEYGLKGNLEKDIEKIKGEEKRDLLSLLGLSPDNLFQSETNDSQLLNEPEDTNEFNLNERTSPDQIATLSLLYPELGKVLQSQKKQKYKEFSVERDYHTGFSKEAEKLAENIRETSPKKETALNFSRNAVETGDLSYFSLDKLADITGVDLFRTAKGAELITAGKENLLSNMSRVSARAQNIWFEQRLNSMFPKIGQSREANLTTQEMLEGELAMDKGYLKEFDRLSSEDMKKYGYVKKDIAKRARKANEPLEKELFKRSSYRMKEIEEVEKGIDTLKKEVGKNVVKGTPLTLAMAKLYKDKFGDNALAIAKKNGYYIPSLEEFKIFQLRPEEYREELNVD